MTDEEMKDRLLRAGRILHEGLDESVIERFDVPAGDLRRAGLRLMGEIGGLLKAWSFEIEEGGMEGLLHYAPYEAEESTLYVLRAAEAAGAEPLALEASGWKDGIHPE